MGMAGGGVSDPAPSEAAWYNPAALGGLKAGEVALGYTLLRTHFEEFPPIQWDTNVDGQVTDDDTPLDLGPEDGHYDGLQVGLAVPLGHRLGLGVSAFVPSDRLMRVSSVEPSLPDYLLYNRRLQRFELAVGLGAHVWKGLHLGAGLQLLASAKVNVVGTLGLAVSGADEEDEDLSQLLSETSLDVHTIDLDVYPELIPTLGGRWELGQLLPALRGWTLGGAWHGSGGLPVDTSVVLQGNVAATNLGELNPLVLGLNIPMELLFVDHYVPTQWSAGLSYELRRKGRGRLACAFAELRHTAWSAMVPSVANVTSGEIQSPLFQLQDPTISDANAYELVLEDTLAPRVGAEVVPLSRETSGRLGRVALALRGGWGLEPSPLVSQGRGTAFLDADRMIFAGGLGLRHADPFQALGPYSWDLFVQRHLLASGELQAPAETRAGAPVDGAPIPIGGHLWSAGLQWSFAY